MKKVILNSLVSLVAFTSLLSTDIKPVEANAGRALFHAGRGTYNAIQNGDEESARVGFWIIGFIVVGGIITAANNS